MEWVTAVAETPCGRCDTRIAVGEPFAVITARAPYTGRFVRCIACAGESAPTSRHRAATFGASSMTDFRASAPHIFDEIEYATGDREPGGDTP